MKKEKYFDTSFKRGLPGRCPIFEYCERRAMTVYLFSKFSEVNYSGDIIKTLENAGEIPSDFEDKYVNMKGEAPEISRNSEFGGFYNACPEIHLFERNHSFGTFGNNSCTCGNWNKDRKKEFEITETKHYSECLEFSNHFYENKLNTTSKKDTQDNFCFTYLMVNRENNLYKIGVSKTPEYREKTLQSAEPKIETIDKVKFSSRKEALNLEKQLHSKFEHLNIRGEWYKLSKDDIEYILHEFNLNR